MAERAVVRHRAEAVALELLPDPSLAPAKVFEQPSQQQMHVQRAVAKECRCIAWTAKWRLKPSPTSGSIKEGG